MPLSRRRFLQSAAASLALPSLARAQAGDGQLFRHGVASGDPLADRVIIWTRITDPSVRNSLEVEWRVATDEALTRIVARGTAASMAARDFTVKVDVAGLEPGRTYYYVFVAGGQRSTVGRTRTLPPRGAGRARLAVVSCANYGAGYFNAYRCIANRDDIDAVVHLGDYIYENTAGVLGKGPEAGRVTLKPMTAATLEEYRLVYAAYRSDVDLQRVHARHPFIAVWDDHELTDNAWADGAAGHDPLRGPWKPRQAAAYRAYLDWMPIRESTQTGIRLYRSFSIGDIADLVMLDTRSQRDRQLLPAEIRKQDGGRRSMLGRAQEEWLTERLRASVADGTAWRLIGQQIMFSALNPPGTLIPDFWEGYPAARRRMLDMLQRGKLTNVAFLSGDFHSSWALDVLYDPASTLRPDLPPLAVEIVTPAISSVPLFAEADMRERAAAIQARLPQVKYVDGERNGYVLLEVTRERLQAEWYFVPNVTTRSDAESRGAAFVCESGSARLSPL